VHSAGAADHEAALERGSDVVRVPLELDRQREDVGVELEQVVGREQPGDDRRGARAQAPDQRDPRGDPELSVVGPMQTLDGPPEQVSAVPWDVEAGHDGEAAVGQALDDVHLPERPVPVQRP